MIDKIQNSMRTATATVAMATRILLRSKPIHHRNRQTPQRPLFILANGPSLNRTINEHNEALGKYDLMAVNFAANTSVFRELQPKHYVLADPYFFNGVQSNAQIAQMWRNLMDAPQELILHLPATMLNHSQARAAAAQKGITLEPFNMVATGGSRAMRYAAMDRGLAMPRPRNVLIPSIMAGIGAGYKRILIAGADHTWTQTLSVDDNNRVITIQPHFYAEDKKHQQEVNKVYADIHLHQVLESMSIAFRSYWEIDEYARSRGIEIFNATPGSFIDAFRRIDADKI